jgi:hypothetical protein
MSFQRKKHEFGFEPPKAAQAGYKIGLGHFI